MSMDICADCTNPVDSDDDPECYVDTSPTSTVCLCERCREYAEPRRVMLVAE